MSLRRAFRFAIFAIRLFSSTYSAFGYYISLISEDDMLNKLSFPPCTGFIGEMLSFDSSSRLDSDISLVPVISRIFCASFSFASVNFYSHGFYISSMIFSFSFMSSTIDFMSVIPSSAKLISFLPDSAIFAIMALSFLFSSLSSLITFS